MVANVKVEYKPKEQKRELMVGDYFECECGIRQISKVGGIQYGLSGPIYLGINTEGAVTNSDESIEKLLSLYDYVKPLEVVSHELKLREI